MQIIYRIPIELTRRSALAPLDAVQGDGNTRAVKISLLENGAPWEVPAGVTAAVAFRKSDGTKGLYDTLPDGTKAVTIESNAVSAVLAPQVLSCAGSVSAAVVFYDGTLQQLATFPFTIRVEKNPAAGQEISNDYYRFSTMEAVSEAVDAALASLETAKQDFLTRAEEALSVVHDTATADAPAIVCESAGEIIRVSDSADRPLKGLTLCGKTTQSGTPTPENPAPLVSVGAGGAINTKVAGKNLLSFDYYKNAGITANGVTATVNKDGSITWTGTATGYVAIELYRGTISAFPQEFTVFALGTFSNVGIMVDIWNVGVSERLYSEVVRSGTPLPINMADYPNAGLIIITMKRLDLVEVSGTVYPMMVAGTAATAEYEPYKEPQTLTAKTPNGLPGIPVTTGGNYTDENGQQWVCDEIDFARGVYGQRVCMETFAISAMQKTLGANCTEYAFYPKYSSNGRNMALCSVMGREKYLYANNDTEHWYVGGIGRIYIQNEKVAAFEANGSVTVLYDLATPIETPLSAEELAAYAAMHTNKPHTTVFNDGGAGMKLSYVADTKTYIDQKLAAISAAVLNN